MNTVQSFDTAGGVFSFPESQAMELLNSKAEQLEYLTQALAAIASGTALSPRGPVASVLAMLANDLAHDVNRLAGIVGLIVGTNEAKGGAA